jgi:hypothetical protein
MRTKIFGKMLLPVTRYRFMVMMFIPNNPHTGRLLLHLSKKGMLTSKSNAFLSTSRHCAL